MRREESCRIGDGYDQVTAMEVATRSLLRRFPRISESPAHQELLGALSRHEVVSKFETTSRAFSERWRSDAISGYASSDTHLLAQALSSDRVSVEVLASLPANASMQAKTSALRTDERLSRAFTTSDGRIDVRWVDWVEVLDSFEEEVETERAERRSAVVAGRAFEGKTDLPEESPLSFASASGTSVGGRSIADDVLAVLAACDVDGNLVRLPPQQLEKKLYSRVNDVLVALGGKWVGGKTMAHKFKESPEAQLALAVSTGTYVKPQDFGFFPTQPREVDLVIKEARLEPGMLVAEPSAGTGALALKAAEMVGLENVHVFELLRSNVNALIEAGFKNVHHGDFLAVEPVPRYDVIVMNPPFGGGADVEHVQHAARFLKPTGRLVAITSKAFEHNTAKKFEDFRDFVEESAGVVQPIEAGAFRSVGTNIETRVISFDAKNFPWNWVVEEPARMRG